MSRTEHILLIEWLGLQRLSYQVTSYTSSVDALNMFWSNPDGFDLVITDMAMPNITGDQPQYPKDIILLNLYIFLIFCINKHI